MTTFAEKLRELSKEAPDAETAAELVAIADRVENGGVAAAADSGGTGHGDPDKPK